MVKVCLWKSFPVKGHPYVKSSLCNACLCVFKFRCANSGSIQNKRGSTVSCKVQLSLVAGSLCTSRFLQISQGPCPKYQEPHRSHAICVTCFRQRNS